MKPSRREVLGLLASSQALAGVAGLSTIKPAQAQNTINGSFNMAAFKPAFPAPSFKLPDLTGQDRRIGDGQDNRFILLNFWATWCPPCVRELPSLEKAMGVLGRDRFMVLAVSVDKARDLPKIKKFQEKFALTFPIVHDQQSAIAKIYGTRQFPSTFLVDPRGNVIAAAKGERDWHSEPAIRYFREMMNRNGQS